MNDPLIELLTRLNDNFERFLAFTIPSLDETVFDRFRAFRVSSQGSAFQLQGVARPDQVQFQELKGIDALVEKLRCNTEQFLRGAPSNHVLLYGPRGTGKSSAVKALLNAYADRGLRIIEITKQALFHLPAIADLVEERPEKFILFCDDLSFDEDDRSFRELKAVLEGGLSARPENLVLYATSNRRHLMRERASTNVPVIVDGELHPGETLEENVSLSDRFGLRIGYPQFDKETYLDIVEGYVELRNLGAVDLDELRMQALRWSRAHGSYSGRTARQFVDDLEGRASLSP